MAKVDLDPVFLRGLRLLYSSKKDSAEHLKDMLNDVIRKKYGSPKMLSNTLHKKYAIEVIDLSDNDKSSDNTIKTNSSSTVNGYENDDDLNMLILDEDLSCIVCKGMDIAARNRLVECQECSSLYHQECHVPNILDSQIDKIPIVWYCHPCVRNNPALQETVAPKTETKSKN